MSVNRLPRQIVENLLEDHNEARPVVYRDKVIKDGILICPHCNTEIHEKGIYSDDDGKTDRHRGCGGVIKLRGPDEETIKKVEQMWGMTFNRDTREWKRAEDSSSDRG